MQYAIIIVRQAGSAAALTPVADQLCLDGDWQIDILAYPQAVKSCIEAQSDAIKDANRYRIIEVANEDTARAHFNANIRRARFVLTGTSSEADADAYYWRQARGAGVESIAYLDQWSNIEQRFPGNSKNDWPDNLAVIDGHDYSLAKTIMPDGVALYITGSPALENIARQVASLRAQGIKPDPQRIIFATEPVADFAQYKLENGFHDEDAFLLALKLIRRHHPGAHIALRLHPRDGIDRWQKHLPQDIECEFDPYTRAESLAHSGLVFGMRSFFLLEAARVGVPVVSLQPNRKTVCPLTDGRMPVIEREGDYTP